MPEGDIQTPMEFAKEHAAELVARRKIAAIPSDHPEFAGFGMKDEDAIRKFFDDQNIWPANEIDKAVREVIASG